MDGVSGVDLDDRAVRHRARGHTGIEGEGWTARVEPSDATLVAEGVKGLAAARGLRAGAPRRGPPAA